MHQITTAAPPLATVVAVAREGEPVALDPGARAGVARCRSALFATLAQGDTHYGVNTGFGSLSRRRIPTDQLAKLQTNLIRSHAAGVGDPLPTDAVRGMLFLLASSLARGRSGVRPELIDAIVNLLNHAITPVVPETGSVGASGDLAPLAHAALALLGEGEVFVGEATTPTPAADALRAAGLEPIALEAKEGLALINGTHLMASRMALAVHDFGRLFDAAVTACALSIDACRATDSTLDPRVYVARNHPGPQAVAERIRTLMVGSQIVASHRANDPRVQDPYSFRCAPVVPGTVLDQGEHARVCLERELGAVTDNPLVFETDEAADIVSAGNFHGMPVALPMDALAIACAHVAGIAERRTYHMLSAFDEQSELNPFLSTDPGLESGLMIAQYTAAAACNELIGLATPASPANITTSAGMEDYNSFGPRSAAKLTRAIRLARSVVAIEMLCAAQAIDVHRPLRTGDALERAHETIRSVVPTLSGDRPPSPDIAAIERLIENGAFGPG